MRFEIVGLRRQGELLTLSIRATDITTAKNQEWLPLYEIFSISEPTAQRFTLIDPVHKQVYKVARDSADTCVCTKDLNAMLLRPNESAQIEATFAAPPADVTKIDVVVPGPIGTIHDVPIS